MKTDSLVDKKARLLHRSAWMEGTITKETEPDADGAVYVTFTVDEEPQHNPAFVRVGETFVVDRDDNDGALVIL